MEPKTAYSRSLLVLAISRATGARNSPANKEAFGIAFFGAAAQKRVQEEERVKKIQIHTCTLHTKLPPKSMRRQCRGDMSMINQETNPQSATPKNVLKTDQITVPVDASYVGEAKLVFFWSILGLQNMHHLQQPATSCLAKCFINTNRSSLAH